MKHRARHTDPLPFPYYYVPVCFFLIVGLGASLYLSLSHYRVYTDIGYSSFCAISKAINCDTVSQSPYSIFIGLPVPIWGVAGYALFLTGVIAAGLPGFRPARLWRILFLVAAVFSLIGIFLAAISTFSIHSYCIMCIVTYGVNFGLLFYAWMIPNRFDPQPFYRGLVEDLRVLMGRKRLLGGVAGVGFGALVLVWGLTPPYWNLTIPATATEVTQGLTEDGHPWIGAENPEITIVEFTDYQCFQCKKMHHHLRSLIDRYPDRIRLVHRHYPMDHTVNPVVKEPFHEGSAVLSVLAIQAGFKGKFWEANDALYQMVADSAGTISTEDLARKIGLNPQELASALKNPKPFQKMIKDIRDGMQWEISGTPSYVVDGEVYEGMIPAELLSDILSADAADIPGDHIK